MTDTQEMRAISGETPKYEELTFADDFMFCKVLLYSCGADTGMGIADAGLPWFWSGSRYRRFVHSYHCLFYTFLFSKLRRCVGGSHRKNLCPDKEKTCTKLKRNYKYFSIAFLNSSIASVS